MKAIVITQPGDPGVMQLQERPVPQVQPNEVLIRVVAAGVNRPDIFQRKGNYPPPAGVVQDVPGLEVSGIIEQVGAQVGELQMGDEVCALIPGGGYAEYVSADAGSCLPKPESISLEDAAALPEVLFTVWHNVFQRGRLQQGERILIYGGSGGIGSMAIQLARLADAVPYTSASSKEKAAWCSSLGAERVVMHHEEDVESVLGAESMDVILDSIGGKYFPVNLELLRAEGRLIYINAMEGRKVALDILKLMRKRIHITGSTLRNRSHDFKKELADDIRNRAFPLLEDARFQSMVQHRFTLAEAAEAHRLMESREFMGKIILLP